MAKKIEWGRESLKLLSKEFINKAIKTHFKKLKKIPARKFNSTGIFPFETLREMVGQFYKKNQELIEDMEVTTKTYIIKDQAQSLFLELNIKLEELINSGLNNPPKKTGLSKITSLFSKKIERPISFKRFSSQFYGLEDFAAKGDETPAISLKELFSTQNLTLNDLHEFLEKNIDQALESIIVATPKKIRKILEFEKAVSSQALQKELCQKPLQGSSKEMFNSFHQTIKPYLDWDEEKLLELFEYIINIAPIACVLPEHIADCVKSAFNAKTQPTSIEGILNDKYFIARLQNNVKKEFSAVNNYLSSKIGNMLMENGEPEKYQAINQAMFKNSTEFLHEYGILHDLKENPNNEQAIQAFRSLKHYTDLQELDFSIRMRRIYLIYGVNTAKTKEQYQLLQNNNLNPGQIISLPLQEIIARCGDPKAAFIATQAQQVTTSSTNGTNDATTNQMVQQVENLVQPTVQNQQQASSPAQAQPVTQNQQPANTQEQPAQNQQPINTSAQPQQPAQPEQSQTTQPPQEPQQPDADSW